MIPTDDIIKIHQAEVRVGLSQRDVKIPDDWSIDIEVQPYVFFDIRYGVKRDVAQRPTGLYFQVYSARYPETWYAWYDRALNEIAFHIKANRILEEGCDCPKA